MTYYDTKTKSALIDIVYHSLDATYIIKDAKKLHNTKKHETNLENLRMI